ncbi:hypothetical protein GF312_12655 [Candidatus Poribacteria bacterium]|nr:hypothetical protein [Candidatus Poribacteria bacterium]
MKNIYIKLAEKLNNNSLALATVIEKRGSAPQIPGSSALFSSKRLLTGTVGGGLLEVNTQKRAYRALHKKTSIIYKFSLTADISSSEEPICGGEATILIDGCPQDHIEIFQDIADSMDKRQPGVLLTHITKTEVDASLDRYWIEAEGKEKNAVFVKFREEISNSLLSKKPELIKTKEDELIFLEPIYPLPNLIIAGAGHIGQALSHLARLLDFEVTVIDDRWEFANKDRFPEAHNIIVDDIGRAMASVEIYPDSYIVIVTRDHKNDADALRQCIDSEAAYVGMIGSKRKIELMREKFLQEGWATPDQWEQVYAPIGIDIHSKTVQEIAISIAAQLVLIRRQINSGEKL